MPSWLAEFPDIVDRIDAFLDAAAESKEKEGHVLGVNQVLINEYQPGQGISPHEDGKAFQPLVATISLGSHTVLDLYHYVSPTTPSPPMIAADEQGKAVAAVPLGHVLLLPRSLFVLTGSLYQSHLHGIAEREGDTVVDAGRENGQADAVVVSNTALLANPEIEAAIRSPEGWTAKRDTRTSVTFRRAEKVLKGGAFAMVGGRMKRG